MATSLAEFVRWLAETPVSHTIRNYGWIIPTVQTLHILGIAAVIGSTSILNLRVIGIAARSQSLASVVGRLGQGAGEMAAAVSQQAAATQEISLNAQQAADSSRTVAADILELDQKAGENDSASMAALEGARHLLSHAALLQEQANKFLRHVRAA